MAMAEGVCAVCGQAAPFKCTACKSAAYCGVQHQKKDWSKHKITCRPFRIESSDELGRYMVATRDIPAKSVIFIEPPLVVGPKWCTNETEKSAPTFPCVGCFRPVFFNQHSCPKCSWPACSPDCKGLIDPQLHGLECGVLCIRSVPKRNDNIAKLRDFFRSDALLTLRCLLLQWRYSERWDTIMKLESHDKQRIGTRYYKEAEERIVSFLDSHYLQPLAEVEREMDQTIIAKRDRQLLHRICGILEVNALNVGLGGDDDDRHEIGALYENACILEHSCMPNCYYTFDTKRQGKITMRAGRLIRAGEHLAIMYTHMLWGTQMRLEHLITNKYFTCKCERCMDPTELGTHLSSLKCLGDIGKDCGGTLLPTNPIDITTEWFCDKCDVHIANEQIEIVLTNIEQEVDGLVSPAASCRRTIATAQEIEALIEKLSHLLHENHYHLFALKHTLIQCYGREKDCNIGDLTDALLKRKIELCEQLLRIVDTIDPCTMRLTLYTGIILYELHVAVLEQSKRNARKVAGDETHINPNELDKVKNYVQRGKDAVSLNTDIVAGRKLFGTFIEAEEELNRYFGQLSI